MSFEEDELSARITLEKKFEFTMITYIEAYYTILESLQTDHDSDAGDNVD